MSLPKEQVKPSDLSEDLGGDGSQNLESSTFDEAHFSGDFDAASGSTPFYCSEINFNEISDTLSVASGISSYSSASRLRRSPNPQVKGSVVRHLQLRQIGAQLQRAFEVGDIGSPSAMAVSTLIAIGTSNGVTLVFDCEQTVKCKLGNAESGLGLVSAVSFNSDASRLLVGYSKGHMTMWDTSNGKLLRNLSEVHTANHGVLLLSFTDDPTMAVVTDTGGSVFEVTFKKLLTSRSYESECIFSGSRGEVCAMEPLRVPKKFRGNPIENLSLVALGTVTKCIVVLLKPVVVVQFTHQLRAETDTIPVLAWQFSFFQHGTRKVCAPLLAFGRKSTIYLFKVSTNGSNKATFEPLPCVQVSYVIRNLCFVNYETLAILDNKECLRFLDVRLDEQVESVDCSDLDIVYEGSRYKGEDTGGNVSKAMAMIGENACSNSMVSFGTQCLILGSHGIHVYSIRSWTDRVAFFSKQKMYPEALRFATSYYNDEVETTSADRVMGIVTQKTEKSQALVAEKIALLLEEFALYLVDREGQKIDNLLTHYAENVPLCIHYAVILPSKYKILDTLYELFAQDPMALTVFLSSLQPYISGGDLPEMNPVIVKDFVNLLTCENKFGELERSLVQLAVTSIDIHQVMIVCKENRLYDAIIYVHNKGMLDYTGPIEEMTDIVAAPLNEKREANYAEIEVGNKLFVYISCCLAGAAYPCGILGPEEARRTRETIVQYLTVPVPANSCRASFYCLRTLLHFNAREFLNVLSLAFEDEQFRDFDEEEGGTVDSPPSSVVNQHKQKIVDILLQLMVREEGFETHEMGALFTFIARQMAKQEGCIQVDKQLFEQVVEYLTSVGVESRMEERQQAMMELLVCGGLNDIPAERLLELAEPARFYRVCEVLYNRQRRFDKVLLCYLNDPARRSQSFGYIPRILGSPDYTASEKEQLETQLVSVIEEFIQVDPISTAALVIDLVPRKLNTILARLEGMPETQYHFLDGAYKVASGEAQNAIAVKDAESVTMMPEVQEKYVELKCMFDPDGVLTFLKNLEYLRDPEMLAICKSHNVHEATAFLLEKLGDVRGAYESYLSNVNERLDQWIQSLTSTAPPSDCDAVASTLGKLVYFLQRNCLSLEPEERETMWFRLLDALMQPQKNSLDRVDLKELTSSLLNSMMGYVTPHSILTKVISDPVYNVSEFRDIRRFIGAMIDTYNFEHIMLSTTNNLIRGDLSSNLMDLKKLANRAILAPVAECSYCVGSFSTSDVREVIVFRCGHAYHRECIDNTLEAVTAAELKCVKCGSMSSIFAFPNSEVRQGEARRVGVVAPRLKSRDAYLRERESATVFSTLSAAQIEALDHFKATQRIHPDEPRMRSISLLSRDDFKLKLCPSPDNLRVMELLS